MPGTFSPPLFKNKPPVSDPGMHHGTCVTHAVMFVAIANQQWRGKRSRNSRRMRNPQFYVSGKRPIGRQGARDTLVGCESFIIRLMVMFLVVFAKSCHFHGNFYEHNIQNLQESSPPLDLQSWKQLGPCHNIPTVFSWIGISVTK